VKRRVGPSEELVEIERREQFDPAIVDSTGLGAAGHITQHLVDRIAAEGNALVFERAARAAPITGQRVARRQIAVMRRGFLRSDIAAQREKDRGAGQPSGRRFPAIAESIGSWNGSAPPDAAERGMELLRFRVGGSATGYAISAPKASLCPSPRRQ
jgi:hypothetical protein